MFERFTDEARRVVVLAQEEARSLDHPQIGTEHLLLGLVHEPRSEVADVLIELGVDVDALRHAVHAVAGRGVEPSPSHLPFSRQAKEALELALRESLQLSHREIRPAHILLGLLRVGDGVAVTVLTRQGVELEDVRMVAKRPAHAAGSAVQRRGLRRWFRWDDDSAEPSTPLLVERLDDQAWEAVTEARRAARDDVVGVVDTRHLLIGIASVPGPGADALAAMGHDRASLAAVGGQPPPEDPDGRPAAPVFSAGARAALRRAADEARQGDVGTGTGHLLLALLPSADRDDVVDALLEAAGVSRDQLRVEAARRLG